MNWEALGAIGEVTGAIAVVLTLGYLAVQIRQANAIARASAFRDLQQQMGSVIVEVAKDPDLNRIWNSALFSEDELSVEDRDRIGLLLYQLFGALNVGYQSAWLDSNIGEYVSRMTDRYLSISHIQGWWSRQRDAHPEPFRSFVDGRLASAVGESNQHST